MIDQDPWYRMPKKQMGEEISKLIYAMQNEQSGRRTRYTKNLELYEGRALGGYYGFGYNISPTDAGADQNYDKLRLIRSAVSTAVSNIYAPQKPKPQFQTLGATWAIRRKAMKLDRICEGILNQRQQDAINVWTFMQDAGAEAALQGVAPIKVTADLNTKRIEHCLVPHPDLFVDPCEGRRPNNLFQREAISEGAAMRMWPKKKAAIRDAKSYEFYQNIGQNRNRSQRMVELQYAWRLPFGPDEPGMWAAVINGEVVDSGDWTAPWFPFVFLYWEKHRDGFWGSGIADEGFNIAESANDLDDRMQDRMRVASNQFIFYRDGMNADDLMLNDARVGVKVPDGVELPQITSVPPFSQMEVNFKEQEVRAYWDAIGISQVSAAARREQGVDSGVAIRTLNDTKAGRQLLKAQRYEQAFVDLAYQYIWRLRELADENDGFSVNYPGGSLLRTIKWKDADPNDDDSYSVTVAPASALPHDPAGRQSMVQDLLGAQIISKETAKQLMGWPDLESELDVENAETEYIDSLIELYLDADEGTWEGSMFEAPEGFIFNKPMALRRFASAWFKAKMEMRTLPKDERPKADFCIQLLSNYIKQLSDIIDQSQQISAALEQAQSPGVTPEAIQPAAA